MDLKQKILNTTQYQQNGHRNTTGTSKTQVAKNTSNTSLTPSQLAEQAKLNSLKHPLDALSKLPNKQSTVERRSGLQDVDEEYLKQNIFRKPLFRRNSAAYDVNVSQSQINQPAAGQHSIPPAEGCISNQKTLQQNSQQQQQNYQQHVAANLTSSQLQMQTQGQNATGTTTMQQNQQSLAVKNQTNNDLHQKQQQNISGHHPAHDFNTTVVPEPELCTTCPNCQTTIYLVRSSDMNQDVTHEVLQNVGDNAGATSNVPA